MGRWQRPGAWFLAAACVALAVGAWRVANGGPATPRSTVETSPPDGARTDATPAPTRTLRGQVQDNRGRPIAGAHVTARRSEAPGEPPLAETRTAANGAWTLTVSRGEALDLSARSDGHVPSVLPIPAGERADPIAFRLETAARLTVTATTSDGAPVPDAHVHIVGSGVWPTRTATAAPDGRATFGDIPAGVYAVRAESASLASRVHEGLFVDEGEEAAVTLVLEAAEPLRGTVVDDQGTPVPAARVWLRAGAVSMMARHTIAGADGTFELGGFPGTEPEVGAEAQGHVPLPGRRLRVGGAPVRVTLARVGGVAGVVRDPQGRPVAHARLEVVGREAGGLDVTLAGPVDAQLRDAEPGSEARGALLPGGHLGVTLGGVPPISAAGRGTAPAPDGPDLFATDGDGRFRLHGVPPGRYRVHVLAPAPFAPTESGEVTVASGATAEAGEVRLALGGNLRVTVRDAAGRGRGDVPVRVEAQGDTLVRTAVTDADGAAAFAGLAGTCRVSAEPPGWPPVSTTVTVAPGVDGTAELVLIDEVFALRGRVVDDRDVPVPGARVRVDARAGAARVARTVTSGADGRFDVDALPSPPYRVTVDHDRFAGSAVDITDAGAALTITLDSGTTLAGRVVDAWSGKPLADATVEVRTPPVTRSGRTDRRGAFRLTRVPPDARALRVRAKGYVTEERSLDFRAVGGAEALDLGDVELTAGASIRGVVVDVIGDPVRDASVSLEHEGGVVVVRTDIAGRFEADGVAAGVHSLHVSHSAAGEGRDGPLRLSPGERIEDLRIVLPARAE